MNSPLSVIIVVVLLSLIGESEAGSKDLPSALVTEEFMVDAVEPGIQLYVRNKHPAEMAQVAAGHVLLYVHGATQPSEATFDLPLDGLSWMDYIASRGWDVYLMDVRGYGRSTRAPELAQANASQAPIVWTEAKVQDVGSVVDFIRKRRGVPKISLLGWSWGTVVMAAYAAGHGDKVSSLVLHEPVWCDARCDFDPHFLETQAAAHGKSQESAAFVASSMAGARSRFQSGAPQDRLDELMPPAWFEAWSTAALATDPVGAKQNPPVMRIPAGVNQDSSDYWQAGKSYYDPKAITVPTLVVVAEWDGLTPPSGARALYKALTNSPGRRIVELTQGTHIIMLEKNRMQLFREVQQFLIDVTAPR
jgi:pimeloyl-ACP methyl ester carboxylesterase